MLLEDVELKSETMKRAMGEGVETVEKYEIWFMGYMAGYDDRQREVMNQMKGK